MTSFSFEFISLSKMFETYCESDPGARHDIPFGRFVRYLTALIGQRPFKIGVQSITSLKEATEGKKIENVDTGVDVVDASNVDQFIKK